jgi:hypothetical protein
MSDNIKIAVVLSREILDEMDSQGLSLEDELRKKDLPVTQGGGGAAGTKDVATIITATAALAPLVVPIVTAIVQRLFPLREVTVEEKQSPDGTRHCKVSVKER